MDIKDGKHLSTRVAGAQTGDPRLAKIGATGHAHGCRERAGLAAGMGKKNAACKDCVQSTPRKEGGGDIVWIAAPASGHHADPAEIHDLRLRGAMQGPLVRRDMSYRTTE